MAKRINRAIELLAEGQAIYYVGGHSGHVLTRAQGREDAGIWADYINVGMEHGSFDMAGLAEYMQGLAEAGPTRSGHRAPTVIVEAPVNGTDAANVRFNAWQFRQILGRGVHGILMCQAESADAVRAFVESCRYPHHSAGVDPALPSPLDRMHGAVRDTKDRLGIGTRGRGSEATAAAIWGISTEEYLERCDPWPLAPWGELLLGVKLGPWFCRIGSRRSRIVARLRRGPARTLPRRDARSARARLFRLPQKSDRFSRDRFAREHRRQARRGNTRHRRPSRGYRGRRPCPPAPDDAGIAKAAKPARFHP
jgi:hypothetical protein